MEFVHKCDFILLIEVIVQIDFDERILANTIIIILISSFSTGTVVSLCSANLLIERVHLALIVDLEVTDFEVDLTSLLFSLVVAFKLYILKTEKGQLATLINQYFFATSALYLCHKAYSEVTQSHIDDLVWLLLLQLFTLSLIFLLLNQLVIKS